MTASRDVSKEAFCHFHPSACTSLSLSSILQDTRVFLLALGSGIEGQPRRIQSILYNGAVRWFVMVEIFFPGDETRRSFINLAGGILFSLLNSPFYNRLFLKKEIEVRFLKKYKIYVQSHS